jgi:hypothetical protein
MRRTPRSGRFILALVFLGPALGLARTAAAEPRLGADRGDLQRQLADLQRRARELDEKMRRIEAELARDAPARAVIPRSLAPARSAAADCKLPVFLDSDGIKHVRLECVDLAAQPTCDPPYVLDERGVRRFRAACATGAAASSSRTDD